MVSFNALKLLNNSVKGNSKRETATREPNPSLGMIEIKIRYDSDYNKRKWYDNDQAMFGFIMQNVVDY